MSSSRERMLAAINGERPDQLPCSFMLFFNLYNRCSDDTEYVERQVEMGLDAYVHCGHLKRSFHPAVVCREWAVEEDGHTVFHRRIETPEGALTGRVRQRNGWPTEDNFPLMKDWIIPRADETLVKPERDLDKLPYLLGGFSDDDIEELRRSSREARGVAEKHDLLTVGGWKGNIGPGNQVDPGVMGADAMAWLSGYEEVMVLSVTEPDLIRRYAEIISDWNMRQIEIYLDVADPDIVFRRAWYETTEFWTPAAYRHIIAPYLKREAELVHQAGKKYGYIVTSAFLPLLDDIMQNGVDVIIGLDPSEGKGTEIQKVKDKVLEYGRAIWGGVSGAITVELGSEEQTRAAVREAAATLGRDGGFILSPVDNVREDTENAWKNTHAFIDEWKRVR